MYVEEQTKRELFLTILPLFSHFKRKSLVYVVDAQALNDPSTQYIEGRLGNRRIFWCPSGYGTSVHLNWNPCNSSFLRADSDVAQ